MPEGNVCGVVGAETASVGNDARMIVFVMHQGHHFIEDVFFVLDMAFDPSTGVRPPTVETLRIDAIDTEELEVSTE